MPPQESQTSKKHRLLSKRRWRVPVFLVVLAFASLFFQFVIEAPISLPDSFLALPVMSLWQPLFGLPLFAFSIWWILDKRIHILVLVVPLFLIGYCGRLLVGAPPNQTEEELKTLTEMWPEEAQQEFIERESKSRYKRRIFPPFE